MLDRITKSFAKTLILWTLLLASCNPSTVYKKEALPPDAVLTARGGVKFDPSVDILFVIDNSGSMGSHQQTLSTNIDEFVKSMSYNALLDYRIAVITTDDTQSGVGGFGGLFFSAPGAPAVITPRTLNGLVHLKNNLNVGTSGSADERVCDPILMALDKQNLSGFNKGWRRKNSHLAIFVITDTEDKSKAYSAKDCYDALVREVGGDSSRLLVYGAYIPHPYTSGPPCSGEGEATVKLDEFFQLTGASKGNVFSLCEPDYGKKMAAVGSAIRTKVGRYIYLDRVPILKSIRVTIGQGSDPLPEDPEFGWTYDPGKKAIVLGSQIDWAKYPSGSKPDIYYLPIKNAEL